MKYVCLGFFDEAALARFHMAETQPLIEECCAFDELLRRRGHYLGGEAIDSASNAVTLRIKDGAVKVSVGPYAETKEPLGGFLRIEARDLNHAISLMSKHPALRIGKVFEIRAANDDVNRIVLRQNEKAE